MIERLAEQVLASGGVILCDSYLVANGGYTLGQARRALKKYATERGLPVGFFGGSLCVLLSKPGKSLPFQVAAYIRIVASKLGVATETVSLAEELASRYNGHATTATRFVAFAALYHATRIRGDPVSSDALMRAFGLRSLPTKFLTHFAREVGVKPAVPRPSSFITEEAVARAIGSEPGSPVVSAVAESARAIADALAPESQGCNPLVVAALATWLACVAREVQVTKTAVAKAYGITEAALRIATRRLRG